MIGSTGRKQLQRNFYTATKYLAVKTSKGNKFKQRDRIKFNVIKIRNYRSSKYTKF